jgi:hypothetical protein
MLAEFAELAMARARAASARAEMVEAEGGDPSVHLVAFDRMGRAMRLALSLRRRLANETQGQAGRRVHARKEGLRAALTPAIRLHAPFAERQELDWALAHRLETEAETLAGLSFEAGLARLSGLLGLPVENHLTDVAETPRSGLQGLDAADDFAVFPAPGLPGRARGDDAHDAASWAAATGPPG